MNTPTTTPATKPATQAATQPATRPAPKLVSDPRQAHITTHLKHSAPFISTRFDPTGRFLFACSEDRSIQRWDLNAANKQTGFTAHDSWAKGLAFSKDGQTLISAGFDGRLIYWPAAADVPKPTKTIEAHQGWIRDLISSPDGALLASAANDQTLKIWSLADGAPIRTLSGFDSHVYSAAFHPTGAFLLGGTLKGAINVFETASGKLLRSLDAKPLWSYNGGQGVDFGGVRSLAFSTDGRYLAAAGLHKAENPLGAVHEPLVLIFDFESGKLLHSLTGSKKGVAWRVMFHPDYYFLSAAGGSEGGWLYFWTFAQAAELHKLQLPNTARDADLHPSSMQVATAHHDSHIRLTRLGPKA